MPSLQLTWGRNAAFAPVANGISSAFDWWSDPFVLSEADSLSVTLAALTETPVAMLVVPSATGGNISNGVPSGDGILYVAATAGATPGNAITVAHSAPSGTPLILLNGAVGTGPGTFSGLMNPAPIAGSIQVLDAGTIIGYDNGQGGFNNVAAGTEITGGSVDYTHGGYTLTTTAASGHAITLNWVPFGATVTNPYTVSTDAITCAPWVGATNGQMAMLANQNSTVQTLVQAYPWGWGAVGSPVNSLNSLLGQAALNDLLVIQPAAPLIGGGASPAVDGVATIETCEDLVNFRAFAAGPNDVTTGALLSGGSLQLHIDACPVGYGRIHWAHSIGSIGQISGMVSINGGAR
jgi:hypothetical protein